MNDYIRFDYFQNNNYYIKNSLLHQNRLHARWNHKMQQLTACNVCKHDPCYKNMYVTYLRFRLLQSLSLEDCEASGFISVAIIIDFSQ